MTKNYKENSYFIKVTAHNPDFYTRTACNTETSAKAAFLLSSEDERLAPLLLEKKKKDFENLAFSDLFSDYIRKREDLRQ